jgi:hypothetical protein
MTSFPLGHNTSRSTRSHPTHRVSAAVQESTDRTVYATTLAGDPTKLRGIPAIGRNVQGHIPGTAPHQR